MGLWSWLFESPSKIQVSSVQTPTRPGRKREDNSSNEIPRSPVCKVKSRLGDKESGYLDQTKLRNALNDLFRQHGQLEFGLHVGWKRPAAVAE